jgi:hypothetical protein
LLICSGGLVKTTPVFTFLDMNNEVKGAWNETINNKKSDVWLSESGFLFQREFFGEIVNKIVI